MEMNSQVSKKMTFFSLVFSVGMVIYHSLGVIGIDKIVCNNGFEGAVVSGVNNIHGILGGMAMQYFFFTSAFLLYCNIDSTNWRRKVCSRMISLGIPYIVWNMPFVIISLMKNRETLNMRFVINRTVWDPFIGPSWYLLALLLLLLFTPIFVCIYKNKRGVWIHTCLCILIIFTNNYLLNLNLYILSSDFSAWIPRLIAYLPTYFIGMYFGFYYAEYYTIFEKNKLILIVMLGTSIFSWLNGTGNSATCILCIFACWYLSDYFIAQIDTDKFLYKCSFLIYMGHSVVLRELSIVYSNLQQIRGYFLLPLLLFSALITVGSICIFAVVLNKCWPRLLRVITGKRFYR